MSAPREPWLMIYNLDAPTQAAEWMTGIGATPQVWSESGSPLEPVRRHPAGIEPFAGAVRTASLFAPTILVTDAQLLDGPFFQALGPDAFHELLGLTDLDAPVLTVSLRRENLEESLRSFVLDDGHLKFVLYSTLRIGVVPDTARLQRLRDWPADAVREAPPGRVAATVAAELARALELPPGSLAALGRRWQQWIDATAEGRVRSRTLSAMAREDHRAAMRTGLDRFGASSVAPPATLDQIAGSYTRSGALDTITGLGLAPEQDDRLRRAFESAYADTMANHLGADWMDIGTSADPAHSTVVRHESDEQLTAPPGRLGLSGEAPRQLGRMTPAAFQTFRFQSRDAIRRWRSERSEQSTRHVAYLIELASAQTDPVEELRRRIRRMVIVAVLAVVTFGLELLPLVSGTLALLPLVVALLATTVPEGVAAWQHRRAISHQRLSSVIHLQHQPLRSKAIP